jgi:hypothetical protein
MRRGWGGGGLDLYLKPLMTFMAYSRTNFTFTFYQLHHRILWNRRVHYRVHNSPRFVLVFSQISPVHTVPFYFLKIRFSVVLTFPLTFPRQKRVYICILPTACHLSWPSHSFSFDHRNSVWWGVQILKLIIMQLSPTSSCFHRLRPNSLLRILFLNTLSLCGSLGVRGKIPTHANQQAKLWFLIF